MKTAEIRRRFLDFFAARGHEVVPSAPLLYNDPTLLFVNAGMVPFKPYFTGVETPPFDRATSVQKCVRTLDIEEVGKTTRHGTFFQMNGNFSFGDYFKAEAIKYAWDLVTGSVDGGGYGFDPDKIWVTVLHSDDEAAAALGEHRRPGAGADPAPRAAGQLLAHGHPRPGRAVQRDLRRPRFGVRARRRPDRRRGPVPGDLEPGLHAGGARRRSGPRTTSTSPRPLPRKNIDTGLGLERVAYLLQGVDNLYEIDQVYPVIEHAAALAGKTLRRRRRRRRPDAGGRRPRPVRADADRRRRHARQRGPRLRAAPAAAPGGPRDAAARRGRAGAARAAAGQPGPDGRVLPGAGQPTGPASPRSRTPRRRRSGAP